MYFVINPKFLKVFWSKLIVQMDYFVQDQTSGCLIFKKRFLHFDKSTQFLSLDFREISKMVKKPLFEYFWIVAHHRFLETDLKFFLKNSTHALTAWAWRNLSLTSTLKWCTFKRLFHSVTFFDVIFDREKEAVQAQNTKNNSEFRHDAYN